MKNLLYLLLLFAPALLTQCGCNPTQRTVESISGSTMGTTFTVKYIPGVNSPGIAELGERVNNELASVNQQMSTYQDDSEISQFNQSSSTDWYPVSKETAQVVQLALDFHQLSDGAFDVSVGPLVSLWGLGPDPKPPTIPNETQIQSLLQFVGSEKLAVRLDSPAIKKQVAGLQIDLSAIAKGHAVDRVALQLESQGVTNYFVEIGGEIRTKGKRMDGIDWQVGIDRPDLSNFSLGEVISLSDASLATSRSTRGAIELEGKQFAPYLDSKTGRPLESDLVSVAVIMPDCASADAAATALMAAGFEKAIQLTERQKWATLIVARRGEAFETISSAEFERQAKRVRN